MSRKIRLRRERLFQQHDGLCYWCGVLTVMPPRNIHNYPPTDNLATVDHLRTRLDEARQEPNFTNEERTVLACWSCNNSRGILHQAMNHDLTVITGENLSDKSHQEQIEKSSIESHGADSPM